MIRVLCTMLAIEIEYLKLRINNRNLPMRKNVICFESIFQKDLNSKNCIFIIMSYL